MSDVAKIGVVYVKLGSVYYPIACTNDININITTEVIELAPRTSQDAREYEYGRYTGTVTGSGLTKITATPDNLYTVFDLIGYQLTKQKTLLKYSVEDEDGNVKVLECNTLITKSGIGKHTNKAATFSYEHQINGPITISSTPVENTNPQTLIYEYTEAASSTELTLPFSDNVTILVVYINGVSKEVKIAPDGYGTGQVQYDPVTKIMQFPDGLAADDYVKIIYIDVDVTLTTLREDGLGHTRVDGAGHDRDTA